MIRYVLTTFDGLHGSSKLYTDVTAAIKDWLEFAGKDPSDWKDWVDAVISEGKATYVADGDGYRFALISRVEVY